MTDTELEVEVAESETEEEAEGGVSFEAPEYSLFAETRDEQRRCFVFAHMASPEIDGNILLKNMDALNEWIKNGGVPVVDSKVSKSGLKPVSKP